MRSLVLCAWLFGVLVAAQGCGGGSDPETRPTATPTATANASAMPAGIDRRELNAARERLVAACEDLDKRTSGAGRDLSVVRASARTYLAAFKAAPDEQFRRSPNSPEITMRKLLSAAGAYLRRSCGDRAGPIAERLSRTARRRGSS